MIPALLTHLWQSTVCVGVAGLLALLLRRNSARLRYGIWFAASAKFLLPFSWLVALGQVIAPTQTPPGVFRSSPLSPELVAQTLAVPFAEMAPAVIQRTMPWQSLLVAAWGLGALLVVGAWARRWWQLRRWVRTSQPLPIEAPVPVRSSAGLLEPGLVGIIRPVLLLPAGFLEQFSPDEVRSVLAHELCHVRRRDNLTYAIHLLGCAAFWFYPLVWWLGPRLIAERERACDEAVLASGHRPELYGACILKVCRQYVTAPVVAACGVSGTDLQRRIRWIMTWGGVAPATVMQKAVLAFAAVTLLSAPLVLGVARAMTPDGASSVPAVVAGAENGTANATFNPADFDECVGYFQYADRRFYQFADFPVVAHVYREGSRYFVQDTGQLATELVPESVDELYAKFTTRINQKQYVFVRGPDGRAREMVTFRPGRVVDDLAPRASRADWEAAASKLKRRVGSRGPSRGTEAALRRQIEGWEKGRQDYLPIPYVVSGSWDEPETPEHFRKTIEDLGTFTELRFVRVSPTGWDVFHARFANGTLEIAVAPLSPSGKFAGESYRLL
jgi:beta-lactamase regulating signal transducer with metallopeptidase domain